MLLINDHPLNLSNKYKGKNKKYYCKLVTLCCELQKQDDFYYNKFAAGSDATRTLQNEMILDGEFDVLCHTEKMLFEKHVDFTLRLKLKYSLIPHSLRVGTSFNITHPNMVSKPQTVRLNHLHPMKNIHNIITIGDYISWLNCIIMTMDKEYSKEHDNISNKNFPILVEFKMNGLSLSLWMTSLPIFAPFNFD